MKAKKLIVVGANVMAALLVATLAASLRAQGPSTPKPNEAVKTLVGRLDLEKYKATIKGLTQFGDRLQGTERNRRAVDWIEAQLKSYGCPTERLKYTYNPPASTPTQPAPAPSPPPVIASGEIRGGPGGSRLRGVALPAIPNMDLNKQIDPALRKLNSEPSTPGPREEVYCTKVGTTRPDEMYIVAAHMDGHG